MSSADQLRVPTPSSLQSNLNVPLVGASYLFPCEAALASLFNFSPSATAYWGPSPSPSAPMIPFDDNNNDPPHFSSSTSAPVAVTDNNNGDSEEEEEVSPPPNPRVTYVRRRRLENTASHHRRQVLLIAVSVFF
jgi:hypothetical protein